MSSIALESFLYEWLAAIEHVGDMSAIRREGEYSTEDVCKGESVPCGVDAKTPDLIIYIKK